MFAHGRFGDFVGIGLSGRDFLRGHILLELARKEVHDYNLVSGGAGGIGVGLRFPRMQVGVANDHQINAICEQSSVDFPTCAENRLSCRLFYLEEREDDKTTEGNGSGDTRLDSFARWKSSDGPEYDYRGILCRVGGEIIYGETGKRTTSTLIHSGREVQIKEGTKQ